ncbi:MAG: diacylglycerol kinase [Gammaproteobacteria bacterium]|jgi:diacylglycerol kinase (ATP)|nr:diacylglycerol kinase [Gammaproteobacteria bacterium]
MGKRGYTGLTRLVHATGFSIKGFAAAWQFESAFRQEVALFIVAAPLGWWLGETGVERALLIGSILFVLVVELLNSAVEAAIDRISDEEHALSGRAKDIGSAAVFLALALAAVVWALVLLD